MAFINDLSINIDLQTKALQQASFGGILILGNRASGDAQIDTYAAYADVSSMLEDGFEATDDEYKMAAQIFSQSPSPAQVSVYTRLDSEDVADSLNKAVAAGLDFYFVLIAERTKAELQDAGDWTAANKRILIASSSDLTVLDSRNNIREFYILHNAPENFPDAAVVGMAAPKTPGSFTWKYLTPNGVSASNFSLTQLNSIRSGNGQTLSERAGVVYLDNGITTGGEFLDVIQVRDWLEIRLGEDLFGLLTRVDKIPYDNNGFAKVEAVVRSRLRNAGELGMLATVSSEEDQANSDEGFFQFKVTVPERSTIPATDRAARKLPQVSFTAVIAGAVHNVAIFGTITV